MSQSSTYSEADDMSDVINKNDEEEDEFENLLLSGPARFFCTCFVALQFDQK